MPYIWAMPFREEDIESGKDKFSNWEDAKLRF
jgi:hypothetical protein